MRRTKIIATLGPATDEPGVLEKLIAAVKKVKKDGNITPWALTQEGKEELERIAAFKKKNAAPTKEDATLFMADLESGLDENAE